VTGAWPLNDGVPLHVSVGFGSDGKPREIFARAKRPETDLDCVADDGAVLASMLLQHGASLEEIAHSLGRSSEGRPTSVVGAIVDVARKIEAELRPHLVETAGRAP
jgi:hypothetical protein